MEGITEAPPPNLPARTREIKPPEEGEKNNLILLVSANNEFMTPEIAKILCYAAMGYSNPEIGEKLGKSPQTVKNQIGSIYEEIEEKKGPTNRPANITELLSILRELNIIYFVSPTGEEHLKKLTPRQKEVVEGRLLGLSLKEIARQMGVSRNTVKNTLTAAYKKMGISAHPGKKLERRLFAYCHLGDNTDDITLEIALFRKEENGSLTRLPDNTNIYRTSSANFFWGIVAVPNKDGT